MLWTFLVMNISTKFQLYPPYGSEEMIFVQFFFANLKFWLPWQPIKFSGFDKIHMVGRGLLNEHSVNVCQNTCCEIAINANFHFSHYKSMANISCHSYAKNTIIRSPAYWWFMWNLVRISVMASGEMSFENVDRRRIYTISSPMRLRFRELINWKGIFRK